MKPTFVSITKYDFMKDLHKLLGIAGLLFLSNIPVQAAGPGSPVKGLTVKTILAETGIKFTEVAWAQVVEQARAENKIIFLDAYTSWCGPCKLLQKNVFTRADVGAVFNKNFINVKVDMERGEGPQLARLFPIEAYPTLFFIEPSGKVIQKVIGYRSAEDLISIGKSVTKVQ